MMNVFEKIREELEDAKSWEDIDGKPRFTFRDEHVLEIAIQIVNQVEQEHNNGWIPCSERLPSMEECQKYDNRFIVSDGNRSYQRFFDYKEKRFCEPFYMGTLNTFYDDCVTHWQPLPQPYKERDTNGN